MLDIYIEFRYTTTCKEKNFTGGALLYRNKNKPPAMQVCSQLALASSKKPPMLS